MSSSHDANDEEIKDSSIRGAVEEVSSTLIADLNILVLNILLCFLIAVGLQNFKLENCEREIKMCMHLNGMFAAISFLS